MKRINIAPDLSFSQISAGYMRVNTSGLDKAGVANFARECLDMGITTIDHADIYGGYGCEEIFGDAVLADCPSLRQQMEIVTKADIVLPGYKGNDILYYTTCTDYLYEQVNRSLRKLHTDYLDVLLLHRPDPLMHPEKTGALLDRLVKEGKTRYVGVSNFTPSQITCLQKFMENTLVVNQVNLSVMAPDIYFDGTVDDALVRGMPFMIWSPLAGGRIFAGQDEAAVRLRAKLEEIAEAHSATIDEIMYAWIAKCPVPATMINGSYKLERVRRAVKGCDICLSHLEWYQILEASRGYSVP